MEQAIDFYFDKNYGKLYEKIENGRAVNYEYEDENGKITNQFLIREIPEKIDGKVYYDLVTPYGYGGPIINYTSNKEKLLENYEKEFSKYCIENNCVSEFIRFHPIIKNYEDFFKIYNSEYMRKTLIIKLDEELPTENQFGKTARKSIRQAKNRGVTYKVTKAPEQINNFKEIYYETMDRNSATDYYYFEDEYFDNILKYYKNNLVYIEIFYEEKVIAAGIFFTYKDIIHVHLTGALKQYLNLSSSYMLIYAITLWGKENGYKLIHQGGGRTNSPDDKLFVFKKNFSQKYDADFYIGKKIWNQEIYDKLCEIKGIDKTEKFFPAYRKN